MEKENLEGHPRHFSYSYMYQMYLAEEYIQYVRKNEQKIVCSEEERMCHLSLQYGLHVHWMWKHPILDTCEYEDFSWLVECSP